MGYFAPLVCALLVGQACAGLILLPRRLPTGQHEDDSLQKPDHPMKYLITGYKDKQGRWNEEVKIENGDEEWHAEIDHAILKTESGKPKVQIKATFTANSAHPGDGKEDVSFVLFAQGDKDWCKAQEKCMESGGNLAVPDSESKFSRMTSLLKQYYFQSGQPDNIAAFVGINDLATEGHFVTVFGKPVFSPEENTWSPPWFCPNQPDDDKDWTEDGEDCGSLRLSGLNDVPCRYNLPYICEMPAAIQNGFAQDTILPEDEREEKLDEDDVLLENFDVRFPSDENEYDEDNDDDNDDDNKEDDDSLRLTQSVASSWQEAKQNCASLGERLAVPDSAEKMDKMAKMLKSRKVNLCAFVDFNDIEREGNFVTSLGKPVFNEGAAWNPQWFSSDQPDDDKSWSKEGEDCGSIHPSGGLNDVPCSYNLPFFCEKNLSNPLDGSTLNPQGEIIPSETTIVPTEVETTPSATTLVPTDVETTPSATTLVPTDVETTPYETTLVPTDVDTTPSGTTPPPITPETTASDTTPVQHEEDTVVEYQLYADPQLNWFEAGRFCKSKGGRLAAPDSEKKIKEMRSYLVGFDLFSIDRYAVFVGKIKVDYYDTNRFCPIMTDLSGTHVGPYVCHYTLPFLCETQKQINSDGGQGGSSSSSQTEETEEKGESDEGENTNTAAEATPVPTEVQTAPSDTTPLQQDVHPILNLTLVNISGTWFKGSRRCRKLGLRLAVTDSPKKIEELQSHLAKSDFTSAFVAFLDPERDRMLAMNPSSNEHIDSFEPTRYCGVVTRTDVMPASCELLLPVFCESQSVNDENNLV